MYMKDIPHILYTAGEVHVHVGYSTQEGNSLCSSQCLMENSRTYILMCPRSIGEKKEKGNDFAVRTVKHVNCRAKVIVPTSVDNG